MTLQQQTLDAVARAGEAARAMREHPKDEAHKIHAHHTLGEAVTLAFRWMVQEFPDVQLVVVEMQVRRAFLNDDYWRTLSVNFDEVRERLKNSSKIRVPVGVAPYSFFEYVQRFKDQKDEPDGKTVLEVFNGLAKLAGNGDLERGIELIHRLEEDGLVLFGQNEANKNPMIFLAAKSDFKSGEDFIAAHRMLEWFDTKGNFDAATGQYETNPPITVHTWLERSGHVIKTLSDVLNMRRELVIATLHQLEARGLLSCYEQSDLGAWVNIRCPVENDWSPTEKRVAEVLAQHYGIHDYGQKPLLRQELGDPKSEREALTEAMLAQHDALNMVQKANTLAGSIKRISKDSEFAGVNYNDDVLALRRAETFCWMNDPIIAVEAASASLPPDMKLTRNLTPTNAGWWYLQRPLDCQTTTNEMQVTAILWDWFREVRPSDNPLIPDRVVSGLSLMAYVRVGSKIMPSTRWFWKEGMTITENLKLARDAYRVEYQKRSEGLLGEELTITAIDQLTRFFAAGCLWMEQRIVVEERRPAERHARRRLERETKKAIPDVRVVHLRRRENVPHERTDHEGDKKEIHWTCRWVVNGHWRQQPYRSTGEIRPIWIRAYDKGPEGLPMRAGAKRVFEVSR